MAKADQVMVRGTPKHVVGYLRDFLFNEQQIFQTDPGLFGYLFEADFFFKPDGLQIAPE